MRKLAAILIMAMLICAGILGLFLVIPDNAIATVYVSGTINTDTTWNLTNSPYIVEGNVSVSSGVTLTIEPGVEVKFNGSYSLTINGTLNAKGTPTLPINITSNRSSPANGDWLGIRLMGSNNTMDYCNISYATNALYITGPNTRNSLSNFRISNSSSGSIFLDSTTNNTIVAVTVSNGVGLGLFLNSSDNNDFGDMNISNNDNDAVLLVDSNQNSFITNSLFSNNGTGFNITGSSNSNTISRNEIINNSVTGMNITASIGNLIHHNNFDSNGKNGYDSSNQLNSWDNGVEGNWWSDYGGSDSDGDGIGDIPHNISGGGSKDFYPLANPVNIDAPIIESTVPENGSKDVSVTPVISITFSSEMNKSSAENATSMSGGASPTNFAWSNGNKTLTFNPSIILSSETQYIVDISNDAKDVADIQMDINYSFYFTTEDIVDPEISSTTPVNGTLEVPVTADIVVVFSEAMNTTSVNFTSTPDPTGWSVVWSAGNTTATYSHNDFASETTYTFNITQGKDLAGNDLTAGASPNPFTFTTEDVVGPQISSTTPANGSVDVPITADIVIVFNEEMNTSSVNFTSSPDPAGWTVVWSGGNTTATYSHNDFASETNYTFNITTAKDVAGNDLVAGAVPNPFTFRTEDALAPRISSTTPANGTTGVPISADIIIDFNEEMNTSSVNFTSSPDPAGWTVVWSAGNTTATYSHNDFNSTTTYTFEITAAKDVAGNDLTAGAVPNPFTFTTEDVAGPWITSTSPANGSVDVQIAAVIAITFNEAMNTSSVTFTSTPDPGGWNVVWSGGNTTATYTHNDFASETNYTFEITAAKDAAGNDLVAGAVPNPFSFKTEDANAPQIASTIPVNGTVDFPVTAVLVITFNEEMNTSSVTFTSSPDPGGWNVVWSGGNTTATYSHNDFASETDYTFEITAAKDLAGNDLVAGAVPNPFTFRTEDAQGPQITSTDPSNGANDVPINADIIVTFSEEINTSSVTFSINPDPGGWSASWSNGNKTVTYSHNNFSSETSYIFQITAARDPAGNDLVGGAVPNPWSFTSEDVVSPEIILTSPSDGAVDVLIFEDIVVTFNEEMNTSSVTFSSAPDPGGWTVSWSGGNTVATYSHNDFSSTTVYTFEITGGKDTSGNDLTAGAYPNPFSFTTEDVAGPQIASTTPTNGSVDVLISADIVINFNEEMNTSSVTYSCTPDPGGWTVVWSGGNTTVTYSHNDFASTTVYTFEITAAKDVSGNDLTAGAVPNPFTFTTEDVVGPQITSTTPPNGTMDVLISADIVIVFNEEMDTSSVTFTSTPDPGGWTVIWSAGNTTATHSHSDFGSEVMYTFEITGARDVAGNDLVGGTVPNPFSFTTEDVIAPQITSTTPVNGTIDVLISADIIVIFSEEMDTTTVTFTSSPDPGGWSVIWSSGNTTATYSHNDFGSEMTYAFEITAAKDPAGNDLVAGAVPNPFSFTTEDAIPPSITVTSPVNGTMDVLIGADIVVTFSEDVNTSSVTFTSTPDPGGWSIVWSGGDTIATYSHNDFASTTLYTFEITGAKDPAGNDLAAGAVPNPFSFATEDVVGPEIGSTSPLDGEMDVLISADIVVNFNEGMDPSTVTYSIAPDPGGWSVSWNSGNTTVTYSHNDFGSEITYTFEITGAKDVAGNDLVGGSVPNPFSFTTEDVISPEVTSTIPINGTVNVLVSQAIVVTFSEDMNTSSITYTSSPEPGGWTVTWSNSNKTATFLHNDFDSEVLYTFEITGAKDPSGNDLISGSLPNPFSFTTEDAKAPTIIFTSPVNGTSNIGQTMNIEITFSEDMDISSLTFASSPNPGGWFVTWSAADTIATISHNPFESYMTYFFQILSAKDPSGNDLASGLAPNPFSFTTKDSISPEITMASPWDGAIDVGLSQDVVVTFSEAVNTSSLTFSSFPDPGGWTVSWSSGDTVATFTHNDFDDSTSHMFQISNIMDLAGNALVGGSVPNPWTFTTVDATSPEITATSPSDASVDIGINSDIVVSFSEPMNTASVTFSCAPDPGGWTVSWNGQNNIATYSHSAFDELRVYTFEIVSAEDGTGNVLVAGSEPNPWTFTTEDLTLPTIIATLPSDSTAGVLLDQDIVITFSEPMDNTSVTYTSIPYPGGWSALWGGANTQLTLSHNPFISNTAYTFQITAAKDLAQNDLVAGVVPNPFSFSTVESIPPTLSLTLPTDGAVDVFTDEDVVVTFSEAMNKTSVAFSCSPDPGGWQVFWSAGDSVATFSHNDFDKSTDYDFQIISGKDLAGNGLIGGSEPNPWSFTTLDNVPPSIQSSPVVSATEEVQYQYDVVAVDGDNGILTYRLTTYPSQMTINSTSGLISWTPSNDQVGLNSVEVRVTDEDGGSDTQSFVITVMNVNDAPVIGSSPVTWATEDVQYSYDVDASDIDGDLLTYSLSTFPGGMTINKTTGLITWTPTNSQVGSHSVLVLVSDGNSGEGSQSFSIDVDNVNDAPVIISSSINSATEDVLYSYDVDAQDIDSGDTLTYGLTTFPSGMTIDPATGVISWTPTNSQVGGNAVTVVVSDIIGSTDSQSFTITVSNTNDAPGIISSPITSATEEALYTYDVDAQDPDMDSLTFVLSTFPSGMVIDNASGLISWTPTNSQVGPNNVVVQVLDGNGADDLQVFTIDVMNANDAPEIISTPINSATEDMQYIYDVDATDEDAGDTLTFSLTTFPTGMTIDPNSGLISWTPSNSHVGTNTVTVSVSDDSGKKDNQSFIISVSNVNDAPTIASSSIGAATEDSQYIYDVEAADVDAGDVLIFILNTYPNGMTIDPNSGAITWTPINSQVGDNFIEVQVTDGNGGFDFQNFTISVANTNDRPMIFSTPITSATDDVPYTYDVDATDIDLGDSLTYALTFYPEGMIIDANSGLIQWTPNDTRVGSNSVFVVVTDSSGDKDYQNFTITVSDANDPPEIISSPLSTASEDSPYSYDVEAIDPDIDILTFVLTTYPAGMTIDSATGLIMWTPTNNQVGANYVVVQVLDGKGGSDEQIFTVTVTNTNDAPQITSTEITLATEDMLYIYDVQADDIDPGDTLTFTLTQAPSGMSIHPQTGIISWTPTNGHVGNNMVTVTVTDLAGADDTQFFTISVSNTNDAPTFSSTPITSGMEDVQYTYDANASDIDLGDTLTYSLTTYPATMVIDSTTGVISWTPTNPDVGTNSVTVKVVDGNGGENTQSFSIMIANANDPPEIISIPTTSATQDIEYTYDVESIDDDWGDDLTYSLSVSPVGMTIDPNSGLISWIPSGLQIGDNPVTVDIFDMSGESDSQVFVVTVANVNDAPQFTSQPVIAATEEAEYLYEVEVQDIDGDTVTFALQIFPDGMIIDDVTGTITWTPTNEQVGSHSVIIQAVDGNGGDTKQSFAVLVENVNDAPTIISSPVLNAQEEVAYTYHVKADDIDKDDNLTFELAVNPSGMVINPQTGIISWTPHYSQVGENSVIVRVIDINGSSDAQSFVILTSNVNDFPTIISVPVEKATEDIAYLYDVDARDIDPGDSLTYALTSSPSGMTIDPQNGIITWTPLDEHVGTNLIVVKVTDTFNASATQTFSIVVKNVNDAPTMSGPSVVPETGDNRDRYVFSLTYMDLDGDSGSAKVIINGISIPMKKVGGDPLTGELFSVETSLGARNHSYYFEIDDDEDHVVVSEVSVIIVTAAEVGDDGEFLPLPIPLWWIVLILIVVIIIILINHSRVKRQLKRQRQMHYKPTPQQFTQKVERKQPAQPKFEEMEKEEPESSLLEF